MAPGRNRLEQQQADAERHGAVHEDRPWRTKGGNGRGKGREGAEAAEAGESVEVQGQVEEQGGQQEREVYQVHCSLNINTETGRLSARRWVRIVY